MLPGRCLRLLCRSAALLLRPPLPAARRLAATAATGVDCPPACHAASTPPPPPPPPPPPALSLVLSQSRRRLTAARPAPAAPAPAALQSPAPAPVPQAPGAVGSGWALRGLTFCCLPAGGAALPAPLSSAAFCLHQLGAGRLTAPGLCPAEVWPAVPSRSFSEQRRHSVVQDMRRTGQRVRATVGHMVSHENIYTIPNALCVARIALTPVIACLVTSELYTPALGCFLVAGVTDMLDGWIARTFPGQSSLLGSFLDPLADKLLVVTLFLSLTYTGLIPLALTLLTVSRDLGLIAAASWVRYKSVPPPVTLSRYFDPTFATARLEPTLISKFNTFLQLSLVASTLAAPVMGFVDHTALRVLWCVTAGTTVTSGMVYALLQSSTYKLMERADDKRPQ